MKLVFEIPRLKAEAEPQRQCKYCGYGKSYIKDRNIRATKDLKQGAIESVRMECLRCGHSFTVAPEGHEIRRRRSNATIAMGVLLYCLGLSYEKVVGFLGALGLEEAVSTVYEDCQRAGKKVKRLNKAMVKGVKVVGIDGTGQKAKGRGSEGVLMAVDLEEGLLLEVELISEDEPEDVRAFLGRIMREYGVEAVVTDEHKSYEGVEELAEGVRHYRCRAHFLRAKLKRTRDLKEKMAQGRWWKKLRLMERVEKMLRAGPIEVRELEGIYREFLQYKSPGVGKEYGLGYKAKLLIQELLEKADSIGQWTNNATERIIGLALKLRSKTMRGFKKRENIKTLTHLLFWLWNNRKNCKLALLT